jgi:DNA helicase-2/ATP-dependent DNA helicase PcrA
VGDDAQSIYSFRGAHHRNILDFPREFPGTTVVTLEQNYRSTPPILETTNELIARAEERYAKRLFSERAGHERPWLVSCRDESEQTRFVVDRLLELHEEGTPLGEMAVLFRAGYLAADLEIELTARGIPYEKWGGLKFLEAAHVKDVLAFLRVLENPRDEVSWYRLLQLLPGVGDVTARGAIAAVARPTGTRRRWRASRRRPRRASGTRSSPTCSPGCRAWCGAPAPDLGAEIGEIRRVYDALLRERYDDPEPRLADLEQLQTIAAGYADRAAFLSALALEPPQSTQDLAPGPPAPRTTCSCCPPATPPRGRSGTWCSSSGRPTGASRWRAPRRPEQVEEERRLLYVAMTRARDELVVTYPMNAYASRWTADYSIDQLSRFLDRGVRETMQRVVVGTAPDARAPAGTGGGARPARPAPRTLRRVSRRDRRAVRSGGRLTRRG